MEVNHLDAPTALLPGNGTLGWTAEGPLQAGPTVFLCQEGFNDSQRKVGQGSRRPGRDTNPEDLFEGVSDAVLPEPTHGVEPSTRVHGYQPFEEESAVIFRAEVLPLSFRKSLFSKL
jgi:hypothetical protein